MNREQFDLAYTKDRHSSIRVLYQETFTLGSFRRDLGFGGDRLQAVKVLCPVVALYVLDLDILCIDARVLTEDGFQPHQFTDKADKRLMETHPFPAAVRRSVVLADQLKAEFSEVCAQIFTGTWAPSP